MVIKPPNLSDEVSKRREIILRELRRRTLWFIQLRWYVPPAIALGIAAALVIGVDFAWGRLLLTASFILAYNLAMFLVGKKLRHQGAWSAEIIKRFTYWQVSLDYSAMFLLIHFTGGAASPFIFFFIFHVIFAAILLPPRSAYGFAALAAAGMAGIAAAEYLHWLPHHALFFQGQAINLAERPFHMAVELGFFAASVFITAFATTSIMPGFRARIDNLAELSNAVVSLNNRLNALYEITQSISSVNRFEQVLDIVTTELRAVMNVRGVAIKLLSEDGRFLTYASVHGLPDEFIRERTVEVAKSPLNRRIIEGEPFAAANLTRPELFQFSEDLAAAGIKSVLFVALTMEKKTIGILGAYSEDTDRFGIDEVDFFRLSASLAAVALENARAFEAIEKLVKERSWFMMRVAHQLRSPLSAMQSILNVILGGFMGELPENQKQYLERVSRRSESMMKMVTELMALAETRSPERTRTRAPVDLVAVARRVGDIFSSEAGKKEIAFSLKLPESLPPVMGDPDLLYQMIENFVSNAIKYTESGGRVTVEIIQDGRDTVTLKFIDTGIGIPQEAMPRLFTEFFRADNAKKMKEIGTGLGLAIVKDIIIQHQGKVAVASEEGKGTTFTVTLPLTRPVPGA
jgi:signal transduction histidine kinase